MDEPRQQLFELTRKALEHVRSNAVAGNLERDYPVLLVEGDLGSHSVILYGDPETEGQEAELWAEHMPEAINQFRARRLVLIMPPNATRHSPLTEYWILAADAGQALAFRIPLPSPKQVGEPELLTLDDRWAAVWASIQASIRDLPEAPSGQLREQLREMAVNVISQTQAAMQVGGQKLAPEEMLEALEEDGAMADLILITVEQALHRRRQGPSVGEPMVILLGEDEETVTVCYASYQGEEVPPYEPFLSTGATSAKLELESGQVVWGCEVWWMPAAQFANYAAGRRVLERSSVEA